MKLRGFTFFEVILYLGIFSLMATALLNFSWDMIDLGTKDRTYRGVVSDGRFVSERLENIMRSSAGIDADASVFDDANGRLVLLRLETSDTVTIDLQDGRVTLTETGRSPVALHSAETRAASLVFQKYGLADDGSEYAGFMLTLESAGYGTTRAPYDATTTIRSGAFIRNNGL